MAEKRFTIVVTGSDGSFHYWDKFTDERITSVLELENKLNELSDENEQLKQTIETQNFNYENAKGVIHSSEHQIQQLQDENEQLKQKILDEIDLEVDYVNKVYSDGRMSIEQYDGAIICLQELRRKFE